MQPRMKIFLPLSYWMLTQEMQRPAMHPTEQALQYQTTLMID
jgi:hypothetical protein